MNKKYERIEFPLSCTIEDAVNLLLEHDKKGNYMFSEFNGTYLYSDTVTMDDAYKTIIGKTKAEFDRLQQEWRENYKKEQLQHKAKTPELSKEWINKGKAVLDVDKWDYWSEIVPIRLGDLYHGMELGCCLNIVKILNDGGTLEEAKAEINKQSHSGMSYGLVCSMVREFCNRGKEFCDYVR